jgi:glycerate 2-kinase
VVTGEGALDVSSLMGKGVGEIARRARRRGLPCFGLAGRIENPAELRPWFVELSALTPDRVPANEALRRPASCLRQLARELAAHL